MNGPTVTSQSTLVSALEAPGPLLTVELRPPPATLNRESSMEAWIDAYHGVQRLLAHDRFVLFTDDAVGAREEESLAHLTTNLGADSDLSRVVPFLTCKHTLEYCLLFARRAASYGFGAITVTGGDGAVGPPRCLPRSRDLRLQIREQGIPLPLGVWVNPYRDPEEQVDFLHNEVGVSSYFLTQVVSHHDMEPVDRFLEAASRRGLPIPGAWGVFHYRSANPRTLERLSSFLPVPAEGLTREFAAGAPADEVTARTLRALRERGIEKVFLANVRIRDAATHLLRIEGLL